MSTAPGFYKCPECGEVELERRVQCTCGFRESARALRQGIGSSAPVAPPETFHQRAAFYCAALPLGALVAMCAGLPVANERAAAIGVMTLMGLLLAGGVGCGLVALSGLGKHGPRRILARTIAGFGMTVGIIVWWALTFLNKPV